MFLTSQKMSYNLHQVLLSLMENGSSIQTKNMPTVGGSQ